MKRATRVTRWGVLAGWVCVCLLTFSAVPAGSFADRATPHAPQGPAATMLIVTSPGDDGCSIFGCPPCDGSSDCTLRQAISRANGLPDPEVDIVFSPLLVGGIILVNSPMPMITRSGLWLLGTDTSYNQIELEIQVQPGSDAFLIVNADDVRLAYLRIVRQAATSGGVTTAIDVRGGRNIIIERNQIGGAFTVGENDKVPMCFLGRVEAGAIGILVRNGVPRDGNVRIVRNTIGCMQNAIVLAGADDILVGRNPNATVPQQGNHIGIEPLTRRPIPNYRGILVADYLPVPGNPDQSFAIANIIAHNTIAHNQTAGILLHGAYGGSGVSVSQVYDNDVYANEWGIALSGVVYNNTAIGVACTGGGANPPCGGNRIYDNRDSGVRIGEGAPHNTTIYGNFIGTADGTIARPNRRGIHVFGQTYWTQIDNNVISGNTAEGILVQGDSAASRPANIRIQNNNIGLTRNLGAALPNGGSGVFVVTAATAIEIVTNIIAGNAQRGVRLDGAAVENNTISQTSIGYYTGAIGIGNGWDGILLTNDTKNNLIEGNHIRFNGFSGIAFSAGNNNTARANLIADNTLYGALFVGAGTVNNRMSNDTIRANGADGIGSRPGVTGNVWRPAAVFGNGGLGIDREAASDSTNQPTDPLPIITRVQRVPSGYTIFGTVPAVPGDRYWIVDLYRAALDPSGHGEGREKIGTIVVNASMDWQWQRSDFADGDKGCYTAIMTLVESGSQWYTTEFSRFVCGNRQFLPGIMRP